MRRWPWLRTAITVAACLTPAAAECQDTAAPSRNQIRVLTLYALSEEAPDGSFLDIAPFYPIRERTFRKVLGDALGDRLDYNSELLDRHHFPDPSYESDFEDYLVRKYRDRTINLLIANGADEADLAGRLQARLASQPPVVVVGLNARLPVPKSTGHTYRYAMKESLDLALRVHPDTRRVFVVCGVTPNDARFENQFRSQVPAPPRGVEFTFLRGPFEPALSDRLATLPEHSIVFLVALSSDRDGRQFRTASVSERLAAASNAPIYTWNGITPGVFGGRLLSHELAAEKTIQLALRVLRGERPEDIPITAIDVSVDALDWRQLDRWNVSEARVPSGVELRFREPGLFEQYRGYILGTLALVLLQTSLIAGLLIQRRNRRLAENSLRESEERFRVMADTAPVMVWRSGPDQGCDFFNKPWLEFRGRRLQDEMGEGWTEGVHPDDLQRCLTTYTAAWPGRESFRMEYRLLRADGEYRWVLDMGVPRLASDGTLLGYIGSCIDITERRQAEEALRVNEAALRQSHAEIEDLAGRLITAQEAERARIARDLHDDISQQLAAISIEMSECKRPDLLGSRELLEVSRPYSNTSSSWPRTFVCCHTTFTLACSSMRISWMPCETIAGSSPTNSHSKWSSRPMEISRSPISRPRCVSTASSRRRCATSPNTPTRGRFVSRYGASRKRFRSRLRMTGRGSTLSRARERGGGLGLRSIEERVRLVGGRLSIETAPQRAQP